MRQCLLAYTAPASVHLPLIHAQQLQALERIAALDRCLSAPAGAVLLCGPSGSGRRSLLQLAAHAQGLRFWSPRISR